MTQSNADQVPDDSSFEEEIARIEGMRSRLQGLFGQDDSEVEKISKENFDGTSLRKAIVNRWGVQYDIQPAKFHNRVYVQVRSPFSFPFTTSRKRFFNWSVQYN